MKRLAGALALVLALAACGGSPGDAGQAGADVAHLWVTSDRGAEVMLDEAVPPGLTVLQALDREADIDTRYGGRFVQSIDGVEGSLASQQDWFYFVNGIEPDVGAAEVELAPGDIAWWDFRSWEQEEEAPVVVGAFPLPFTRGWGGLVRPVEIRFPPALADAADALRPLLGAGGSGEPNVFELVITDGADGAELSATRGPANDSPVTFTLAGSEDAVRAAATALAADPAIVRRRYTARFDAAGKVVG